MKKLILLAVLIAFTVSCEDFEGWNIDKKHPSNVSGSFLFTNAEKNLALRMQSTSVNYNIFKMYAQHWTETTYVDEANYDLVNRNVGGNFWTNLYQGVLINLDESKKIITDDVLLSDAKKAQQIAVIELLEVYTWHVLVDTFGDIPYTEALQGIDNLIPKYDDDAAIYSDLFKRIDNALATLNLGGENFGSADLFYNGNNSNWIKFGNTLKLKMAVRIKYVDPGNAAATAKSALNGGVFESSADNFAFPFEATPPNTNPLWTSLVQSGRKDFILANTFVDEIVPLNDPRRFVLMQENLGDDTFKGGPYGENNSYANYTHIGEIFHTPDFEGLLMSYSETEFLRAEAADMTGENAEDHYNMAVKANFAYWGVDGADAYLAQPKVKFNPLNPNASIGVQKWISLFGRGFEAWASWKLLDYPNSMNRPPVSELPVPRRYIYPNDENDVNGENYQAASDAIGGDNLDSRVFWDVNGDGN